MARLRDMADKYKAPCYSERLNTDAQGFRLGVCFQPYSDVLSTTCVKAAIVRMTRTINC
jgi:hypothetical protein